MKHLEVQAGQWTIEWDAAYIPPLYPVPGAQPRRGWTIMYEGAILVELEPSFWRAIMRARQRRPWAWWFR